MPGIWTLRGNSSTARSGWVAADAATQCRFCWPSARKLAVVGRGPSASAERSVLAELSRFIDREAAEHIGGSARGYLGVGGHPTSPGMAY